MNVLDRRCNDCTLCCKLIPVRELKKPANTPCVHQRSGKGCTIYARRPESCVLWSCAWLTDEQAAGLARPDHAHYVIDLSPDYVEIDYGEKRMRERLGVVQVWLDPRFPHAHRDPALRAWLEQRCAKTGQAAIIRTSSESAFVLFPPALCADGQWHEQAGQSTKEHSMREVFDTYARFKQLEAMNDGAHHERKARPGADSALD